MKVARRRALRAALGGAALFTLGPSVLGKNHAAAQSTTTGPVLVELFTSQGCSSCPPADKLLGELARREGVIALTFNVDYWDYLGWPDRLARPEHSQRQRAYARAQRGGMIYTPQMVIHGREGVIGSRARDVDAAIAKYAATPAHAVVGIDAGPDGARVSLAPATPVAMPCMVELIGYSTRVDESIGKGENAGRQISYHNVVRETRQLGAWAGEQERVLEAPATAGVSVDGYVALLKSSEGGPILAVAQSALVSG